MGVFEKWLSLWVALCIGAGVLLGVAFPDLFAALAALEVAQVNLPVAVLIWAMIVPMLMKIDFAAMGDVGRHWRGIGVTLAVNWAIKPFLMFGLGLFFLGWLFRPLLPEAEIGEYLAGLILLGAAPCTAMVFVWSHLSGGEPRFTLSQVALNDAVMVLAFAPIVALLLGLSAVVVPWSTLLLSVMIYIVVPLVLAQVARRRLLARGGEAGLKRALDRLSPAGAGALLLTLVFLFAFQGEQILERPLVIALIAVPILLQGVLTFALAYGLNRALGEPHAIAGPSALIGASNFFELAVAAAIAMFGLDSGAALATVVGVLVEVPAMLALVAVVNRTKAWYERRPAVVPASRSAP